MGIEKSSCSDDILRCKSERTWEQALLGDDQGFLGPLLENTTAFNFIWNTLNVELRTITCFLIVPEHPPHSRQLFLQTKNCGDKQEDIESILTKEKAKHKS